MTIGDVAIVYDDNRLKMRFDEKTRKYSDAITVSNSLLLPYTMTVLGRISQESIDILSSALEHNKTAIREILVNTQFAMYRGIYQGILRLKIRTSMASLFEEDEE